MDFKEKKILVLLLVVIRQTNKIFWNKMIYWNSFVREMTLPGWSCSSKDKEKGDLWTFFIFAGKVRRSCVCDLSENKYCYNSQFILTIYNTYWSTCLFFDFLSCWFLNKFVIFSIFFSIPSALLLRSVIIIFISSIINSCAK